MSKVDQIPAKKLVLSKEQIIFLMTVEIPTTTEPAEINFQAKHFKSTVWAKMREENSEKIKTAVDALFAAAKEEAAKELKAKSAKKLPKGAKAVEIDEETELLALTKPVKESEIAAMRNKMSAQIMLKIFDGWDLDNPFNEANLIEMCDMYPASPEAIFNKYNESLQGKRLGN